MKKQIEEMAKIMCRCCSHKCDDTSGCIVEDYAEAIYNEGYRKQEWISVEERLPECENVAETEALLFMTSAGRIEAGYFGRGSVWRDVYFRHYRNSVGWDVSDVTHWMPMPEPPKGE